LSLRAPVSGGDGEKHPKKHWKKGGNAIQRAVSFKWFNGAAQPPPMPTEKTIESP
jgi:hypothetical protein